MCPPSTLEKLSAGQTSVQDTLGSTDIPACVPTDPLSRAVYTHVQAHLHPLILAHSLRAYLHAKSLSLLENTIWHTSTHLPLLFTACLFHDMGTSASCDGPQRFEVEGADAASAFLTSHAPDIPQSNVHEVWTAIALHTSPGIAERISVLARLLNFAVLVEFKAPHAVALVDKADIEAADRTFPRGDIEKVLSDVVVEQAERSRQPEVKAPIASWPGVLLRWKRENPEWTGVNKAFFDAVQ